MDAETGGSGRARVSVGAVEDLIRSFSGVESARIALDAEGALREIHVLADSSRPPKAIVRDIESGLRARWGLVVDHRRISVAQMDDTPRRPKWMRLRLQQISVQTDPVRGRIEVAVSLAPEAPRDAFGRPVYDPEVPNVIWQGRAAGASGGGLGIRLAAEATLQALNQSLLPQHTFSVVDLQRVAIGDRDAVLCLMQYQAPRGAAEMLTGSALVRNDPLEAAVRCVLNSTNRIYGVAMRRNVAGAGALVEPEGEDWPGEVAAGAEPDVEPRSPSPPAPSD
jgi:hypothetical protein